MIVGKRMIDDAGYMLLKCAIPDGKVLYAHPRYAF